MACLTILEIGIFVFCVVVNKGLESLEENPMLGPNSATLYLAGGLHLQEGQYWRLFTCIFLHAGVFHLLPNMLVQWWIGAAVEAHWGAWWTAALYLLSGLGGSLLSAVLSDPAQLSVGASGALHGLMAAGAAGGAGELGWPATLKAWIGAGSGSAKTWCGRHAILISLVISVVSGLAFPRVDSWAHLGGMLAGFAVAGVRTQAGGRCRCCLRTGAAAVGLAGGGACVYLLGCGGCVEPPGGAHELLRVLLM